MSLRLKFVLYLLFTHLLFASVAIYLLLKQRLWLFFVEAVFLISLTYGWKLVKKFFGSLDLIRTGTQFINDGDFATRFNETGQPEMDRLVQIYNQMTDRLREERVTLQEQQYFLAKILDASPSGIVTFNFDCRISSANPAAERLLQRTQASLAGATLEQLDTAFCRELSRLGPGESQIVPLHGRRRVKCQRSHFMDRGFERDFILMEELTEELRQSEKAAYEKLIRMMSHEVNNTVGSANSLLHSCLNYKDQLAGEERKDYEEALGVVIGRAEQLSRFTKSFADVVRLADPQRTPCDVRDLLQRVYLLMRPEFEARNIKWEWKVEPSEGLVSMDRAQMEQVFINIVKNAAEAIERNGAIIAHIGTEGGQRFIAIEDTGCGITPETRAQLFSPFYTTKENGQGIGLTLVQEILTRHHFDFSLEAEPGQLTRFTILF